MRLNFSILAVFIGILIAANTFVYAKGTLLVLNRDDATLTIIDAEKMIVLGIVPTGDSPHEVVMTADGKTAIVANYGAQTAGKTLSIIDVETKKETKRVELSPLLRPHGLVERAGKIYFTVEVNQIVGRYDLATGKIDWLIGTGQSGSHMLVVTPDQKRIYTANVGSDSVTALAFANVPPSGSKVTHIPVGKQPEAIDIAPNGKEVWVGLNTEGAIDIIDTATNTVTEKIKLGARPYRVRFSPDGKLVVATIPSTKDLAVIDPATRKETKRIQLESVPLGGVITKDSKFAFVITVQDNFVVKVNLEAGEVVGKLAVGKAPDGIALSEL